ncbi:MAG: hypothetical protein IT292_00565 [Deltaproteobacteria bacterium]|nr:hypothetical protein [Deltaproteobacteria bacterium]
MATCQNNSYCRFEILDLAGVPALILKDDYSPIYITVSLAHLLAISNRDRLSDYGETFEALILFARRSLPEQQKRLLTNPAQPTLSEELIMNSAQGTPLLMFCDYNRQLLEISENQNITHEYYHLITAYNISELNNIYSLVASIKGQRVEIVKSWFDKFSTSRFQDLTTTLNHVIQRLDSLMPSGVTISISTTTALLVQSIDADLLMTVALAILEASDFVSPRGRLEIGAITSELDSLAFEKSTTLIIRARRTNDIRDKRSAWESLLLSRLYSYRSRIVQMSNSDDGLVKESNVSFGLGKFIVKGCVCFSENLLAIESIVANSNIGFMLNREDADTITLCVLLPITA